ncbi:MAG: hypothetical protein KC503_38105 [Myxococcales bacterium]|nr:hypothetical protein [Myxococcales bacterium]
MSRKKITGPQQPLPRDDDEKPLGDPPKIEDPVAEKSFTQRVKLPLLIYIIVLGGYLGASGGRLKKPTADIHYVYLAQCLLEGRLSLKGSPPHQNDWALVIELELRNGEKVRGTFMKTGGPNVFRTTRGEKRLIEPKDIKRRRYRYYVSFPWFPALLMLPFVAIWGLKFNDVIFTCVLGSFNAVLVFLVLRKLVELKLSQRSLREDLWLVAMFAFGTVNFYSSVIGQVWYTAHVVGVTITAVYALCALGGRRPYLAGLMLGLGFVTRTPIPFSFALLLGEVLRKHMAESASAGLVDPLAPTRRPALWPWIKAGWAKVDKKPALRELSLAALPAIAVAGVAFVLNYLRFDRFFEFGHYYLNVRWKERIQRWGLFNYHFVARNLSAMLTLLPRIMARPPFVKVSWHGMSMFVTTPLLAYAIWPRRRSPVQPWLYLAVLGPMILHLFYQNSGWVQFGFRFSLDYMVYLVAILAVGGRKIGIFAQALIVFGIGVNTFGAITFGRYWNYYWDGMYPAG